MSNSDSRIFYPGSRLGIFGGGQLGRMFAHAAQRLGYQVVVFSPEPNCPASQVVRETIQADYEDPQAVRRFAESVDVISLEFENIPLDAVARAAEITPVRPGYHTLSVAQHRIREKTTLQQAGFTVTPFFEITSLADLDKAVEEIGFPMVLKTASWGYDGKGQRKVSNVREATAAIELLGPSSIIAEKMIPFIAEASILVARTPLNDVAVFPMFFNEHANHILDITRCPAPPEILHLSKQAEEMGCAVASALGCIGLLCIEFFIDENHQLMINEIAPRPHNSGHLTMEACKTSQFEQQVRAICNLPLGDTSLVQPAAMANLLGDVWNSGQPRFDLLLGNSGAFLHLYGKQAPRPGRKMGHLTCLESTSDLASQKARKLRDALRYPDSSLFD